MVLGIILIVLSVVLMLVGLNYQMNKIRVLRAFKQGNVIVFGAKGKGKDLFFQKVIEWKKRKPYFSNIFYGYKYTNISMKELDLNNDYHNLINEGVNIIEKDYRFEKRDIYFSDVGVYLPSQYDSYLHKTYKSFPIAYALSRHLWNNNIHCNTQNLERCWKALREQADSFIWCRRTYKLPFILIVSYVQYEKYQSALQRLLPMKKSHSGSDKNLYNQYNAANGKINKGFIILRKNKIKYDTRAFHKIFFDNAPYQIKQETQHGESIV